MPLLRTSLTVLIVEDNPDDLELMLHALRRGGYDPDYRCVDNAEALDSALQAQPWEVILCDYALPRFSGLEALRTIREIHRLDIPFIFVSGAIGEEAAVTLMRAGAQDFVRKDNPSRVVAAIERELSAAETRRKKREMDEKLEVERQLLRQLMAGIPDAIYFKDLQHRYIHLNDAERRHLNITCDEEVLGKTADVFVSPERARMEWEEEEKIFATGKPLVERIENDIQADGTVRWFSATMAPIRDHRGEIIGLVGVTRDVSEAKRLDEMKDQFIATVRHELRTPLTAIHASLGLLRGSVLTQNIGQATRLVEIGHDNCAKLLALVGDLLDTVNLEKGDMRYARRPVDVAELVEATIAAGRERALRKGVRLIAQASLPQVEVNADRERLLQVLAKLIANAVDAAPADSEVRIGAHETDGGKVRIAVVDQGPGVPRDLEPRLFKRFSQGNSSDAREKGGVGLGLFIAKSIVEAHGGTIGFANSVDRGAEFFFELPICHDPATPRRAAAKG